MLSHIPSRVFVPTSREKPCLKYKAKKFRNLCRTYNVFVYLFTHAQHVIKHHTAGRTFSYGTYSFSVQKGDKRGCTLRKHGIVLLRWSNWWLWCKLHLLGSSLRCCTESSRSLDWQPWKLLIATIHFFHIISVFAPVRRSINIFKRRLWLDLTCK